VTAAAELWTYRNLIYNLAQRELRSRYKKSVLGWAWSLINPASTLLIYSVVFGVLLKGQAPDMGSGRDGNFALNLFCGLVVWNFFAGTLTGSISALMGAGPLLNKVYFPAACPPIANMFTIMLQAVIEGGILMVIMVALGNAGPTFLLFPVLLVFVGLFGLGIGMVAAVYNVYLRDVNYLVSIMMNVLFYMTPIVYTLQTVKDALPDWAYTLYTLSPLTQFVNWSRDAFYLLKWPSLGSFAGTAAAAMLTFLVGAVIFQRKARNVIEEI
jgi:ABC-type polysaccharide/polyol phosphate export permease